MSFFGDKVEPEKVEEEVTPEVTEPVVEKIKLGEEEYTQDELKRLVDLGKIGVEAEEKYNTSLDKVWPEFGRKSTQLKEYEERIASLEESRNKPNLPENEQQAIEEARAAARKLGITLDEDVETKVGAKLEKEFRNYYLRERSAEKLLEETSKLEKEIDGSDGRPKFKTEEVLAFMQENPGFKNPIDAYEARYKSQTDEWRANQIVKAKRGIVTNNDNLGVDKQPADVKVTSSNLDQMIRESLNS
jgi:hypothetical protein